MPAFSRVEMANASPPPNRMRSDPPPARALVPARTRHVVALCSHRIAGRPGRLLDGVAHYLPAPTEVENVALDLTKDEVRRPHACACNLPAISYLTLASCA